MKRELKDPSYTQEEIVDEYKTLSSQGFIRDNSVTDEGLKALEPYKVTNAVIMAAGSSSRFVPLSFDKPKGLTVVKGEILIERQIKQLQAAGISEIYVVVGYMKEQFFYLKEKFNVTLIINNDYTFRNNTGSLWLVKDYIANTYICSSDDYFTENVFERYVYQSYYALEYMHGNTTERGAVIASDGRIIKTYPGAENAWALMGHVYWDREFSQSFINHLATIYDDDATKPLLWERIFDRFLNELPPLFSKKYNSVIFEFDTVEELKAFDSDCLVNNDSSIINNIITLLNCHREDLNSFQLMNAGLTNNSFSFICQGQKYVYRHCFPFSKNIIHRDRESAIQKIITDLGFDKTCLYIDPERGWKLSKYVHHTGMNFNDEEQLSVAIEITRKIHHIVVDKSLRVDFRKEILNIYRLLGRISDPYADMCSELQEMIFELLDYVETDAWPLCLTHDDINAGNFLVHDGKYDLIDWEYAGLNDRAYDIAKFVLKAEATGEKAHRIISKYYGRDCTLEEERHILACGAIEDFYWFIWAIYLEQNGKNLQNDIRVWHRHARDYGKIALQMYRASSF